MAVKKTTTKKRTKKATKADAKASTAKTDPKPKPTKAKPATEDRKPSTAARVAEIVVENPDITGAELTAQLEKEGHTRSQPATVYAPMGTAKRVIRLLQERGALKG